MKILIYKRTHKGDPSKEGIFGNDDCMGKIRNWNYDAVIGIGGSSPWKKDADIKHKINWIGLEPKRINTPNKRGDKVVFAHFELYEDKGVNIKDNFPNLFEYMYGSRKRFDMSTDLPEDVLGEVKKILDSIKNSPASRAYDVENDEILEISKAFNTSKCTGCCFGSEKIELTIQEC